VPARQKPWGTGHAVWAARYVVKEPFAVINADDFYGSESYRAIAEFLGSQALQDQSKFAMVGFNLQNTISDYGSVSRGICTIKDEHLLDINEQTHIERNKAGVIAYKDEKGITQSISSDPVVSMNFWGFFPDFFPLCEDSFKKFLMQMPDTEIHSEFFLPDCIKEQVQSGNITVKVLRSSSKWLGVTYADDKAVVKEKLRLLHDTGLYPTPLF
jgi:UTP-glucose-1-phosphate uridylyltransferase